jgi:NAD(P)-dependent dehydrogenase (short-subunit alcohol dehydrogenase family)
MGVEGLLAGKRAVIAGVGVGLGRETAMLFGRAGAAVALIARNPDRINAVAREIETSGGTALCVVGDIGKVDDCERFAAAIGGGFGRVDVLVNVAAGGGGTTLEDEDARLSGWREGYETTVFGTMQITRALLPLMKASGDARIIMINTMSAERSVSGLIGYNTPKAALAAITRSLALELGPYGIRVNGVHPGTIISDEIRQTYFAGRAAAEGKSVEQVEDDEIASTVLGFLPDSADIANAVLFLASPMARAITGQALHVNSGQWPTIEHPFHLQPGLRARDRILRGEPGPGS